jgi:hypothetical protein
MILTGMGRLPCIEGWKVQDVSQPLTASNKIGGAVWFFRTISPT